MEDETFWDFCTDGSVRSAVADFIMGNKKLSSIFKDKAYYELEDGIVDLIKSLKDEIYRERNRELLRDDVVKQIKSAVGSNGADIIANAIPIDTIDSIAKKWNSELEDDDTYYDIIWNTLNDVIIDNMDLFDVDNYTEEEAWMYAAFLHEWYSEHTIAPLTMGEFLRQELLDDVARAHYKAMAIKYQKEVEGELL